MDTLVHFSKFFDSPIKMSRYKIDRSYLLIGEIDQVIFWTINSSIIEPFLPNANEPVKVKVWFQNRRIKSRKSQKEQSKP